MTGFMWACIKGHTTLVNFMINLSKEFDIDLNKRDDCGKTGFMFACENDQKEIVKMIIENRRKYRLKTSRT